MGKVYILESEYFGLFEVWADFARLKARLEQEGSGVTVRPYGEGWNLYLEGRHSPVGLVREHQVL